MQNNSQEKCAQDIANTIIILLKIRLGAFVKVAEIEYQNKIYLINYKLMESQEKNAKEDVITVG